MKRGQRRAAGTSRAATPRVALAQKEKAGKVKEKAGRAEVETARAVALDLEDRAGRVGGTLPT